MRSKPFDERRAGECSAVGCTEPVAPRVYEHGARPQRCVAHLTRDKARGERFEADGFSTEPGPTPAWMADPSLLPKRPPGRTA